MVAEMSNTEVGLWAALCYRVGEGTLWILLHSPFLFKNMTSFKYRGTEVGVVGAA